MSLPPELRSVCFRLSSTPALQLPYITSTLIQNVLSCHEVLSTHGGDSKEDKSERSLLIHKLKTQISTLLFGKSAEGRFCAAALIKAMVDAGGWTVLRGTEPWVRGLIAVLGKQDGSAAKQVCILAITRIYLMTHHYQTLVREITTPTLPTFVTSCLNLVVERHSNKPSDASAPLAQAVFDSFASLVPHHPSIFRPASTRIQLAALPYLAVTATDGRLVSSSLKQSARNVSILLHYTAAKNAGGEEWTKALRKLVGEIHSSADSVFRAVIEDWESVTGYVSRQVEIDGTLSGGGKSDQDYPKWKGIDAGMERLVGLVELLNEYFMLPTLGAVSVPLGVILDLTTRLLSLTPQSSLQFHPGVERVEREALLAGLPIIQVAALRVILGLSHRFQKDFLPISKACIDLMTWSFTSTGKNEQYRTVSYQILACFLPIGGPLMAKKEIQRLIPLIRSCCADASSSFTAESLNPGRDGQSNLLVGSAVGMKKKPPSNNGINADTFLQKPSANLDDTAFKNPDLLEAASQLLPTLLEYLPHEHLDVSLRGLIDRTAILSHNKDAMLASVLHPFVGKNGRSLASITPHLARQFAEHSSVESLLKPRFPYLPAKPSHFQNFDAADEEGEDQDEDGGVAQEVNDKADHDMDISAILHEQIFTNTGTDPAPAAQAPQTQSVTIPSPPAFPIASKSEAVASTAGPDMTGLAVTESPVLVEPSSMVAASTGTTYTVPDSSTPATHESAEMQDSDDDSDESVHLNMELMDSDEEMST